MRRVITDIDLLILIPLTNTAAVTLCQVRRTLRRVDMMHSDDMTLYIDPRSGFFRRTDENTNITASHFSRQRLFFYITVKVVNKGDLFRRYAASNQLRFNIRVKVKIIFLLDLFFFFTFVLRLFRALWHTAIEKDNLRPLRFIRFTISGKNVFHRLVDLAVREIQIFCRRIRRNDSFVDQYLSRHTHVQRHHERKSVICQSVMLAIDVFQHILLVDKITYMVKQRRGWRFDVPDIRSRRRYINIIRTDKIKILTHHAHEIRNVLQLRESGFRLILLSGNVHLRLRFNVSENRTPRIEIINSRLFQQIALNIALHTEELRKTIGRRSSGCENDAVSSLAHQLSEYVKMRRLLRYFILADSRYILPRWKIQIFIIMRFV